MIPFNADLIESFAGVFLSPMYDSPRPTPEFHRAGWRLYASSAPLAGLAAPRGHAKSTAFTHDFGLAAALFRWEPHILLVSATEDLCKSHLADISKELHDNDDLRDEFGVQSFPVDAKEELVCRLADGYEFRILARGAGQKLRGLKWNGRRPGLVLCHEKGTRINDGGLQMLVEEHSSAREQECEGLIISVHGLPYPEVVTGEHRYWSRRIFQRKKRRIENGARVNWTEYEKKTGWQEAQNLSPRDYKDGSYYADWIGRPIDMEVVGPQIDLQDAYDPEFWWAVGLWWGDGSSAPGNNHVVWYIADDDTQTSLRLESFLKAHRLHYTGHQREGCYSLTVTNGFLADWLKSWKVGGNSQKIAPAWVLKLHPAFQAELLKGYFAADGFVDYGQKEVRLTSVCYEGLLQVRDILARIGIAASIRKGISPGQAVFPGGRVCNTQQKYDLRFQNGASKLGIDIPEVGRYALQKTFIEDGFLWSQVKEVSPSGLRTFVPISTESHTYLTSFGLSHNCDDMEEDEQVASKDRREKFAQWVLRALLPIVRRGGRVRWHGTILHVDSFLAGIMKDSTWKSLFFKAHEGYDDFSNILWPEQFPEDELRAIRQRYINKGDSAGYSQEYLNSPLDSEDAYIRREWFLPMTEADREVDKLVGVACDFAISKRDKANRTSITIGGKDAANRLHFVDQRVGKWDTYEIIGELFEVCRQHRPAAIFVEKGQIWSALEPVIRKEMLIRNMWLNLVAIPPMKDKAARGRALQNRMRAGGTRWDTQAWWFPGMQDEMLHFTGHGEAIRDDQFDSAALLAVGFEKMAELDQDDFRSEEEIEMEEQDPRVALGRNPVTGY